VSVLLRVSDVFYRCVEGSRPRAASLPWSEQVATTSPFESLGRSKLCFVQVSASPGKPGYFVIFTDLSRNSFVYALLMS
jgi:hypothetical protein